MASSGGDQVAAVMIAAAQSIGKVYIIGAVGWLSAIYPKRRPLLPIASVGTVARFSFYVLTLALIYSTTAQSVNATSIGDYWFLSAGAFAVLPISYLTATLLGYLLIPSVLKNNPADFTALRIAATFPNIVALPILIFPSLCEFSVVYEGYALDDTLSSAQMQAQCTTSSNAMIFCYFFSWSLAFWIFGYPQLMSAAANSNTDVTEEMSVEGTGMVELSTSHEAASATPIVEEEGPVVTVPGDNGEVEQAEKSWRSALKRKLRTISDALIMTFTSPGFLTMAAGIVTGFIPPLQKALFEPGGALRFLGSAVDTMGQSSSALSTIVVAASLVPHVEKPTEETNEEGQPGETGLASKVQDRNDLIEEEENPIMSDPNYGPVRRRKIPISSLRSSARRRSSLIWQSLSKPTKQKSERRRLLLWFVLSRFIVAPAVVVATILGLDCSGGFLDGVPNLAKLVVIINSCLPGALIIVVLLQSEPTMTNSAAVVAMVYLPSYLLSIVTIAAWTAVGLWITVPDQNGKTFCER